MNLKTDFPPISFVGLYKQTGQRADVLEAYDAAVHNTAMVLWR